VTAPRVFGRTSEKRIRTLSELADRYRAKPRTTGIRGQLGKTTLMLARELATQGRWVPALTAVEEAIAASRADDTRRRGMFQRMLAAALLDRTDLLLSQVPEEAAGSADPADDVEEALHLLGPWLASRDLRYAWLVARAHYLNGRVALGADDLDTAGVELPRSLRIVAELRSYRHADAWVRRWCADLLRLIAEHRRRVGDPDEAAVPARLSAELAEAGSPQEFTRLAAQFPTVLFATLR
jgi:hypothetical protein